MKANRFFYLYLIALFAAPIASYGPAAYSMLAKLEAATKKQCLTHDWPKDKHQVHIDWCHANMYRTK
jgi:hypothetical protein